MKKLSFRLMLLLMGVLAISTMTSCSDDDNDEPQKPEEVKKDLLIGCILPNPDGASGTSYMQLVNGEKEAEYTNEKAIESSFSAPPIIRGNEIYVLPGLVGEVDLLKVYTVKNNEVIKKGEIQLPAKSGADAMEIVGNKIYVSFSALGAIAVFDKNTLNKIKEIDITSYGIGDKNPDPCQMVYRNNILYVALNQLVGKNHIPNPARAKADILLIDTKTDTPIKMITEETAGMSMPSLDDADDYSMFIDEKGDIYVNCISGFGFVGHKAGFLRIKKGEKDFDSSYSFDITSAAIEGETNTASYITKIKYVGNGILYATATVPAYYSSTPDYLKDKVIFPVKIDLRNKTIKVVGKPSTNYGIYVNIYKGKVIYGLVTGTDKGFYVYDPKADKMSEKPLIKLPGYPYYAIPIAE